MRGTLHLLRNAEPGDDGATPVTPVDNSLPESVAPEVAPETAAPEESHDTFAALEKAMAENGLLEGVEATPAADKPPATPDKAEATADTPKAEKPEADLTPPEGMSERAQSRWKDLTERVKQVPELERQATEARTQLDAVRQMVAQSGLAQEEFTSMLETGRLLKSTEPADLEAALERLDGIRADIALRLGKDVPGADPLAQHPDLRDEVDSMSITRERALEIARLRGTDRKIQAQNTEQAEATRVKTEIEAGAASIDVELAKGVGQPGHDAKVAYVRAQLADPARQLQFVQTYQPKQWAAAVKMMYDAYVPPAAPAQQNSGQPLRPGNTRAGAPMNIAPRNAEAAVEGAFARLGL